MKKKMIGCFAAVLVVTGGLIVVFPKWMEYEMEKRLNMIEVVVASEDLLPRTQISEQKITTISVPSAYLNDSVYVTKEDVLGKVTTRDGLIPKGSFFYLSALEDASEVSDAAILDLHEGQFLVALETDIVALGASALSRGQRVDIYVTLRDSLKQTKTGSLLKNVRILGVKDHKGLNLDDPDSTHTPHVIQLAISEEALPLFQLASQAGEISYYANSNAYRTQQECLIDWESEMIEELGYQRKEAIE